MKLSMRAHAFFVCVMLKPLTICWLASVADIVYVLYSLDVHTIGNVLVESCRRLMVNNSLVCI